MGDVLMALRFPGNETMLIGCSCAGLLAAVFEVTEKMLC
jgi:hypothetical protein